MIFLFLLCLLHDFWSYYVFFLAEYSFFSVNVTDNRYYFSLSEEAALIVTISFSPRCWRINREESLPGSKQNPELQLNSKNDSISIAHSHLFRSAGQHGKFDITLDKKHIFINFFNKKLSRNNLNKTSVSVSAGPSRRSRGRASERLWAAAQTIPPQRRG